MKAKKFPKWPAAVALLAAVLILVLFFLQKLLMPKYMSDIVEGNLVEEYYQETTDHEVIFVGDCEVYENFSPIEMYRDYGITSYIRGSAQQLAWQSYYLLEDTLRYETPKVVVFNVLALKYNEPQSEAYNRMSIDGMKWSKSKIGAIQSSMTEEENMLDYIFPILRYHSRWSELSAEDFQYMFHKDKLFHNGYYMRVDVRPAEGFPEPDILADYTLGSNAMGYLDKMRRLCEDNGVRRLCRGRGLVKQGKHPGRRGYGVLELREDAGNVVKGLGVLVGVTQKAGKLPHGDSPGHSGKPAGNGHPGIDGGIHKPGGRISDRRKKQTNRSYGFWCRRTNCS